MDFDDYKLTAAERLANGVVAAPDKLTGTAQQNKALFDRLISGDGLFADKYNNLLDALSGPDAAAAIGAEDADGESTTVQGALDAITGSGLKVFKMSGRQDIETAQEAYDWLIAGNYPILVINDEYYFAYNVRYAGLLPVQDFCPINRTTCGTVLNYGYDRVMTAEGYRFNISEGIVTSVVTIDPTENRFLNPQVNYLTPYTPLYDGSPATKKYVDDAVAGGGGGSGVKWAVYGETTATQIYLWHTDGYAVALEKDKRIYYLAEVSNSEILMYSRAKFSCAPYTNNDRIFINFVEAIGNATTTWSVSSMELPPPPPSDIGGLVLTNIAGGGMTWAPRS